jgi:hypothetical protein
VAEKSHYYPTPCNDLLGEGEGGCYLYGSEDALNKNVRYQKYILRQKYIPFLNHLKKALTSIFEILFFDVHKILYFHYLNIKETYFVKSLN